ncbi:methyltransferase domain-containing protein [Streptomyces sp. P9(2023)]|uniref:protein-L-isoaspartate O-methyltransferase family protein n=1 Tax=Streptomyces sp. P9(2023) TaxID=3064394 RepID=UPI0028F43556|nr:methyltransferase domain-containing protein [Streptomyces sp. P9(2023)]MDT9691361.1 methyltransferase domain-containing protein [Streptomyces sp. P9(2023)]
MIWPGQASGTGQTDAIDRRIDPARWRQAVYSDVSLTTQWDDGEHSGTGKGRTPTCSNSQPSMVFSMLAALDVEPGSRVLEVGTGTGWNAALLSERFGSPNVVTVEVDADNAATARARLGAAGYSPMAVVGDGAEGWKPSAPFDRVLITASLRQVPRAIVEQVRPGGIIVAPYATEYGGEGVVRLTVREDGSASGPFVGSSAFMRLRQQRTQRTHVREYLGGKPWPADGAKSMTSTSPEELGDWLPMFAIGLQTAGVFPWAEVYDDGSYTLWLRDKAVTSWASIDYVPGAEEFEVYQSGPRTLWGEVQSAYSWWHLQGRPGFERFGITVAAGGLAHAWLDSPSHSVPRVG